MTAQENWTENLKELSKKGYDCLFDALGGGPVLDQVLQNISPASGVYIYGVLENKPFTISNSTVFFSGMAIQGFLVFPWWMKVSKDIETRIRENYSKYLKNELATENGFTLSLKDLKEGNKTIEEALTFAQKNAQGGKVLIDFRV